jgi:hypothetical protein
MRIFKGLGDIKKINFFENQNGDFLMGFNMAILSNHRGDPSQNLKFWPSRRSHKNNAIVREVDALYIDLTTTTATSVTARFITQS